MVVERDALVFLYAYLRQIDLSLDRSRWTSWGELKDYYSNVKISPMRVSSYLLKYSNPNFNSVEFPCSIKENNFFKKFRFFLFKIFKKVPSLTALEVLCCCTLLSSFDKYLGMDFPTYNLEIEKLRMDIAKFNRTVLGSRLLRKDWEKAMSIEHYLQNPILKTTAMEEFSGGIHL